ncbi:uracil-DNA glycosylase [Desulfomarina sp.]
MKKNTFPAWSFAMRINDLAAFVRNIRSILCYHREIGVDSYPSKDEISLFLGIEPGQLHHENTGMEKVSAVVLPEKDSSPEREAEGASARNSFVELKKEITTCRSCDLCQDRIYSVPGRGSEKSRLMVVGDWLAAVDGEQLAAGLVFGVEQDRMLLRMFSAINVAFEDVFVTNVIKCAVPESCHPLASHVQCCLPFLRRQIVTVQPDVLCIMGGVAAKTILGQTRSLSQLRGKFHDYETEMGGTVPVLVTYHPTFLLENPEMKRATWEDLQLLAKKMSGFR